MSVETVAPITTYFRVCDGVRVRFADTRADDDLTVLLLAPWPESVWAFRRIWDRVSAVGRVVAIAEPVCIEPSHEQGSRLIGDAPQTHEHAACALREEGTL